MFTLKLYNKIVTAKLIITQYSARNVYMFSKLQLANM